MSFSAFNGKAAELNKRVFELLKSVCLPVKENGTSLVSQGCVPFYDTSLIIRQVEKPWTGDRTDEEIKVKLEQRILHYAIVPQVAFFRNEQTVSFVSPYFRGGNLEQAIQNETDKTPGKTPHKPTAKPQTLSLPEKLRILQQICCAIEYLHQPPKCDRKAVTHGNINMKNVILDEQKNARLLVLKPRSVEGVGEEQFTGDKNKDVHDFKEMICKVLIDDSKTKDSILKSVSKKAVTFEDISKNLEVNLRQTGKTKWTPSQEASKKCEICCVNKPVPFCNELEHDSCSTKIKMCVGCMRNWQYNPVKCHSCKQPKINSPVGDRWGAILIAGTDKKSDVTKRFEDDIAKLKDKLITEVTVMGVREKNVITVTKSSTQYNEQLKKAFNQIDTSDINTLVLCYSGHHGDARFELDSENGKYLEDADLISNMNKLKHVEKIVLFLDCCFPKILDLSCEIVLQLNAVKVSEQASCESKGSQYINEIVDAVTNPCELECCNNTQIIREYDLHTHLSRYRDRYNHTQPSCQIVTGREIDRILAFRPVRSGWLNVLEKSLKSSKLQVLKTRLIKYILHEYSTIPLNPILQHKHSKLVDFYEPTKMTITVEETKHKDGKTRKPDDVPETVQRDLSKIEELFISNRSYGYKSPSYINRVYISGEAGMGKTCFSQYLALAWCAVHGETEECVSMREKMKKFKHFNDIEYLKQTQLLFLLHLREFENESDCKNMLRTFMQSDLGYSNEDINELLSDINSPNTVLLMDGIDEWKGTTTKMPLYTSVSDAIIICTSRPWKIDSCVTARLQDYNKVVITGIGFDSVGNLVRNVTNCFIQERIAVRENLSDFIQTLRDKELRKIINLNAPASHEVLMIPVLILLLLCLWHDGKDFESTRTQVYINMTEALLRRMKKKQGIHYKEATSYYQLPVLFDTLEAKCCIEQSENITKLSEIAFSLLFTGQTEHSLQFTNKDLSLLRFSGGENLEIKKMFKDIKQFCLNSGNIRGTTKMSSSSQDKIYRFIHKSYQEFFAALHIVAQNCDKHICQEIKANTTSLQDVVDLTNVFDFVCEFDSNCIESMVSLIDQLTTKHAMQTDDNRRTNFIKTMQGIIFESCFKNIKEGKVSINLSNLVVNGSDREPALQREELMKLLRTNENKIERNHLEINLNKKVGVLCLSFVSLSSDMDVSQFNMKELILVEVRTEFVSLKIIQRLKRIQICLKEPTTVSIQFKDAKKLNYLKLKNCSLAGPLDLSQCPLKELKLNMTKVETETLFITSCVEKCETLNMCCSFDFTNAIKLTNLNVMSCSLPGPLDLSQCPLDELKLYDVQTEKVVIGCVETCTVRHMNCSFKFKNAIEITNLSMMDCSIQGSLDLSKRSLVELNLQRVKTEKVVTGYVETCKVVDMNCSFVFKNANKLSMKDCSLPDSLDLPECSLEELTLYNVQTKNVVTGCVKTCTVMRMNCLFELANAITLTNLSMQSCYIPGQLNLSQCPLEELTMQTCSLSCQLDLSKCPLKKLTIQKCFFAGILDLSHCQLETLILDAINTKDVVKCCMETCMVENMDCPFDFSNAINLTNLSMISCSLPGPLDLSQCPLKTLKLCKVQTTKVVTGSVETFTVENMDCSFKFTNAVKPTSLSKKDCSLPGPLDLSECPLEELTLHKVRTEKGFTGCVRTGKIVHMVCVLEFTNTIELTNLSMKRCFLAGSLDLSQCPLKKLMLDEVNANIDGSFDFTKAIKLTNLCMVSCSLPGPLDLSQCPLEELKLHNVQTEKVVTGYVVTCEVADMDCSFEFSNAIKLTNLSMKNCSIPGPLDLSKCPLEELNLRKVQTEKVVTGHVVTCEVVDMSCSFEFTNAIKLIKFSMSACFLPGPLDLSQSPLKELNLRKVQTEKVVTGDVVTCEVVDMNCLFEFTKAIKLIDLSMKDCSPSGPLNLSYCPLKKFNMEKCSLSGQLDLSHCSLELLILDRVTAEKVIIGCVNTCFLKSMSCSWQLVHCGVQNCIHDQPLTIFELKKACDLTSTIELSKSSIEHLILNEPNISPPVFEDQMRHIYSLSRHMTCTLRGLKNYWENMDVGKKLMEAIEKMKTDGRFSVKQNSRTVTIRTRH